MVNELYHHGIKGQKWGVRRYQNEDGSLTELGTYRNRAIKAAKTKTAVDRIYNSMSDNDKILLGDDIPRKEFLTLDEGEFVVKRFLDKDGDTPVAWLDIMTTTKAGELTVAIGTDPNHRGQGRALKLAKKGIAWFDKNADKMGAEYLSWDPRKDNAGSIRTAENAGFTYDPDRVDRKIDKDWLAYTYRRQR